MNKKIRQVLLKFVPILLLIALLSGCMSSSGGSQGESSSEIISPDDLYNSLWLSPLCGMPAEGCFASEGFFLAEDGTLQFLNIFSMTGDSWSLEDNTLRLYSHTERYPEPSETQYRLQKSEAVVSLLWEGEESEMKAPRAVKLSPLFPEGKWLLNSMLNPDEAPSNPDEPAYIEIRKDEQGAVILQGNGGVNMFRGSLELEGFSWKGGPAMRTLMAGPALEYEDLFMRNLERISRYLLVEDTLFLYEESELVLMLQRASD